MSVTLVDVLAAARARCAPMVGELAGYLVLGVADQVAAAPRLAAAADVSLGPDGAVRLVAGRAAAEHAAEAALRDLLKRLLATASSAPPALLRASQGASGRGVAVLIQQLEASLIPLNRAAGKRAATRLYRETKRALDDGALEAVRAEVDRSTNVEMDSGEPPEATERAAAKASPLVGEGPAQSCEMPRPRPVLESVATADIADPEGEVALGEFTGACHVEVVVESSSPPPCVQEPVSSVRNPALAGPVVAEVDQTDLSGLVLEEVTRPEPVVRRAAQGVAACAPPRPEAPTAHGLPAGPGEQESSMTPPLGSILASDHRGPADEDGGVLPEAAAPLPDLDRTDPMHQGEYLGISESLGNFALEMGLEEDDAEVVKDSDPSCPVPSQTHDSLPLVGGHEKPGDGERVASFSAAWVTPDEGRASDPGPPSRQFVFESPPWAPNATGARQPSDASPCRWLREPGWAWPDVSPVPPALQLVPAPVASSGGDPVARAGGPVRDCGAAAATREWPSAEESLPPEDEWELAAVETSAAAAVRAARASAAFCPRRSEVDDLLASFSVADQREDSDVCRDLKRMAGLDLTPLPGTPLGEK